jgi:hypothetical protein
MKGNLECWFLRNLAINKIAVQAINTSARDVF